VLRRSSLAEISPANCTRAQEIFIVLKMYFDGSWSSRCMTLSCLAADEGVWRYFENEWRGILAERGNAPYMHMKEAMPLHGAFKGWRPKDRDFVIQGLLGLLMQVGQNRRFHSFTCSVDLDAHAKWQARNRLPSAARLCARLVFPRVMDWYGAFPDPILDAVDVFFDRDEPFIGHISSDWNSKKMRRMFPVWNLVRTIAPADMSKTPPIQGADMIAWSAHRLSCKKLGEKSALLFPRKYILADTFDEFLTTATQIFNGPAGFHILLDEYILATRRFPEAGAGKESYYLRRKR
jgi:hypothetical protein